MDPLSRRRKSVIAPAPPAERGNGGCAGQAAVRAMMAPWMRRIVRPLRGPVRSGHSHERLKTHHVMYQGYHTFNQIATSFKNDRRGGAETRPYRTRQLKFKPVFFGLERGEKPARTESSGFPCKSDSAVGAIHELPLHRSVQRRFSLRIGPST